MKLSKEEEEMIICFRQEKLDRIANSLLQKSCKHPNAKYQGSYGHNGDDWYFCPDCKLVWSN